MAPKAAHAETLVEGAKTSRSMQVIDDKVDPVWGYAPPEDTKPRATFVYLHGICGAAQNGCQHFRGAPGWLVCPQANGSCTGGGHQWSGTLEDKAAVVDRAVRAANAAWPASVNAPVVLIGFSQGAYFASDLSRARPGRYASALLMGANIRDHASAFAARGFSRVAMACGEYDGTFPVMRQTIASASRAGFSARFADLGRVGHVYIQQDGTDTALTELLMWLTEPAPAEPS